MAALPPKNILDGIRGLRGKARITFPGANLNVKKVERILTVDRKTWALPFYTADDEHTDCKLIVQEKISEDNQKVEVYRAYHTLPGVLLIGRENDPETGKRLVTTRQIVRADAPLPDNAGGVFYSLQPVDDVISIHIAQDYSALLTGDTVSYPEISYTFPGLLFMRGRTLSERSQPSSYRAARSQIVRARQVITFSLEPLEEEIFQWNGVNLRSDAGTFSDVLHDLKDAVIGGRRVPVEPSEPSAKEYPIGEEVLIRAPSELSTYGAIYRTQKIYITLQ